MLIPEYVLIVASSGRMLAQAAKNLGLKPLVIDLFADIDTQRYAESFRQVPSLSKGYLISSVDYFVKRYSVTHVIYGSGLENHPESLYYLNSRLTILGNSPEIFVVLHNKSLFFSELDRLDIPYPDSTFNKPETIDDWLVKPMQGHGGIGIERYNAGDKSDSSSYWQKYQYGTPHSVLFLADGQQVQVVGFNRQWSVSLKDIGEFVFSGIINSSDLPVEQELLVTTWLKKFVHVFALKGLNSLDFIQSGDKSFVLEINPRISASMQLYDADLLIRHIKASTGELMDKPALQSGYTAYQIIYAEQDVAIPQSFVWPAWCMDLPPPEALIRTGQPICSIIAHQKQAQSVFKQLLVKQHYLRKGFYPHGI